MLSSRDSGGTPGFRGISAEIALNPGSEICSRVRARSSCCSSFSVEPCTDCGCVVERLVCSILLEPVMYSILLFVLVL